MGAFDKFYSLETLSHGYDDLSVLQATGTINSVARNSGVTGAAVSTGVKWGKYAVITSNAAHNLTRGDQINITGTTDYDGPTRVIAIISSTQFVIRRPFTVTKTGNWDRKAAEGNFDGFRVLNGDMAGSSISFVYWRPEQQGGLDGVANFSKDIIYRTPGGLKTVTCATAATSPTAPTIRLIRAASVRPGGLRNPVPAQVISYNPTGGTGGVTVDILGQNFALAPDNNVVYFGSKVAPVIAADQEGCILTIVLPTGGVSAPINVKSHGLAGATGPTFVVT